MNHYEIVTIIPGSVTEDDLGAVKSEITEALEKYKVSVRAESSLGRRKLAYPIRKSGVNVTHGTYLIYNVDADSSAAFGIDETFRLSPSILRHLIVEEQVLTPEQKAARTALQEKIRNKRAAQEIQKAEEEKSATAEPQEKVSQEQLDKKLDTLLDEDIKV